MIRTAFRLQRPDTLEEAARLLADAGRDGCVLGGGSVLVPALSAGHMAPDLVLDLSRLGLGRIRDYGDRVEIGAGATYADLERSVAVRTRLPLLADMVLGVTGGPGLWNLATLGGAACRANPASDGPGCLVALDVRFRLVSVRGSREVAATRFFLGAFETERAHDEILTGIVVPVPAAPQGVAYLKLKHAASSWPIVTASCILAGGARQDHVRLCLGGAAPVPLLLEWPGNGPLDASKAFAMGQEAAAAIRAEWTDELAGPGYRRAVAGTMAARAIQAAAGLAA